jgi:hypothetical protein
MRVSHILRVLFAIFFSGAIGWISLALFNFVKVMQRLEAFQATVPDADYGVLPAVIEDAIGNMQGGPALFVAAAVAGVLLGEIFKSSSLVFYAGATGALTAALASGLWQQAQALGSGQTAASLAIAGFVAGSVYWAIAGYSARGGNPKAQPKARR